MKLLHIADLHIGKVYREVSFLDDQIYLLDEIVNVCLEEKIDALLIAGDIYQNSIPGSDAIKAFNDFLIKLSKNNIKTYIISGNHDNEERVTYLNELIKDKGIYIANKYQGELSKLVLNDEYGKLNLYMLPFFKPIEIRRLFNNEAVKNSNDALKLILGKENIDYNERNIMMMHQFLSGAIKSDSEEVAVGGVDAIDYHELCDFDYVALGHIHSPQKIGRDYIRYSGSLMKYSFSEINQQKSITIIDIKEKGNLIITEKYLKARKDFREVKGMLNDILKLPPSDDYMSVVLCDEEIMMDAKLSVYMHYPNTMRIRVENSKTNYDEEIKSEEIMENSDPLSLFKEFYKINNGNVEPNDNLIKIIEDAIKEVGDN